MGHLRRQPVDGRGALRRGEHPVTGGIQGVGGRPSRVLRGGLDSDLYVPVLPWNCIIPNSTTRGLSGRLDSVPPLELEILFPDFWLRAWRPLAPCTRGVHCKGHLVSLGSLLHTPSTEPRAHTGSESAQVCACRGDSFPATDGCGHQAGCFSGWPHLLRGLSRDALGWGALSSTGP